MIAHVAGILEHIGNNFVIVDVSGVGYKVFVSTSYLNEIGKIGDKVKIFTEQIVREDSVALYGFKTREEKNLFNSLLSVSGIGPKSAMSIVSGVELDRLVAAISQGNTEILSSIPGIGTKTAQRIIIELKEKIGKTYGIKAADMAKGISGDEGIISDSISALITLGYSPREARDAIMKITEEVKSVEDAIKKALKFLI